MFAVVGEFMDDLVDMVFIRLTKLCAHITVKDNPVRGAFTQIGDKFGLILFRAVMGRFDIGARDLFAMIHAHHLFSGTREEIFLEGHFSTDEFECHSRRIGTEERENRFMFIRFGTGLC